MRGVGVESDLDDDGGLEGMVARGLVTTVGGEDMLRSAVAQPHGGAAIAAPDGAKLKSCL